jgi:uncharacterized Zn finger protein (UPF0148 family)
MFEPYKKNTIVICPDCQEEGRIVERSTDYASYILECKNCGRKELTDSEEMKARAAYNKRMKDGANRMLGDTTLLKKKPKKPE